MNYLSKIQSVLEPLTEGYNKVALFDFPRHDNVGDLAIWLGETYFFQKVLHKKIVAVEHCKAEVLPPLSPDTLVLLHGGGNLGDIWPEHENFRLRVIERYPNNRIVLLPQSLHFSSREALMQSAAITTKHGDFHVCVRDAESVPDAGTLAFPERVHLCPDMALSLGTLPRPNPPSREFYALRRIDKEAAGFGEFPENLESGDWIGAPVSRLASIVGRVDRWFTRYPSRLRSLSFVRIRLYEMLAREHLNRGVAQLSSAEVIVTDRLHAHILCSLMGIPHVVLDNSYGKIARFRRQWNTGAGLCSPAPDWEQAAVLAEAVLADVRQESS
ncbi:MAG: polysaccharide pyruvyl transferase family protein [Congregibacter sp.]